MVLYMFLLGFESLVALQAVYAYRDGYLTMAQAKRLDHTPRKTLAVWIEHPGMWGDIFIVSPICAYILARFRGSWNSHGLLLSLLVSLIAGTVMLVLWKKGSKDLDESLARDEKLTVSGWLHGAYMAVAIFCLVLFFVFTPSALISRAEARWISCLMIFHVFLGFVCPEAHTYKRVSLPTICLTLLIWAAIAYRWYCITTF